MEMSETLGFYHVFVSFSGLLGVIDGTMSLRIIAKDWVDQVVLMREECDDFPFKLLRMNVISP